MLAYEGSEGSSGRAGGEMPSEEALDRLDPADHLGRSASALRDSVLKSLDWLSQRCRR